MLVVELFLIASDILEKKIKLDMKLWFINWQELWSQEFRRLGRGQESCGFGLNLFYRGVGVTYCN